MRSRRGTTALLFARRGAGGGSGGQILIIAILIMFAVASLAALFAAIVGAQIVQVTRYTDVSELRQAVESALNYANEELTYSRRGADWRPDANAGPLRCGSALVNLSVSYVPDPVQPGSRFLGIAAVATFRDNPFLKLAMLAKKPLLLTDYARFITDRYELRQPADLGAAGVEVGGNLRATATGASPYVFSIAGPIRSNTDLLWYGPSRVDLLSTIGTSGLTGVPLRDDRIEVAGWMKPGPAAGEQTTYLGQSDPRTQLQTKGLSASPLDLFVNGTEYTPQSHNLFAPVNMAEQWGYANGYSDMWSGASGFTAYPNAWRVLADLPPYTPQLGSQISPPSFSVPRVQPPRMDAVQPELHTNRYLMLTRDSANWMDKDDKGSTVPFYNPGAYGWGWVDSGGGIYIDNTADIQYNHDLEKLRQNWMGGYYQTEGGDARPHRDANAPADWWDKTGRYYLPPGAEIILHGDAPCPYIEIRRDDVRYVTSANGKVTGNCYWQDRYGYPLTSDYTGYAANWQAGECARLATSDTGHVVSSSPGVLYPDTAIFPFPPNGVIYLEGNALVRGVMPRAHRDPQGRYFNNDYDPNTGRTREFHLQIVSGGTIYVEGDLLTATAAKVFGTDNPSDSQLPAWDQQYASRLALIARDNVCLNTTALFPRPANLFTVMDGNYYNDAQPIYPKDDPNAAPAATWQQKGYPEYLWFRGKEGQDPNDWDGKTPLPTDPPSIDFLYWNPWFLNAATRILPGVKDVRLLLGQGGLYSTDTTNFLPSPPQTAAPGNTAEVDVNLSGTNSQYTSPSALTSPWVGDTLYHFVMTGNANAAIAQSNQWYTLASGQPVISSDNNFLEWLPSTVQPMLFTHETGTNATGNVWLTGNGDHLTFTPLVKPALDTTSPVRQWAVAPEELSYLLGPVAVAPPRNTDPLPVEVHALVYAQNGSWFVLPGPWFNQDPSKVYSYDDLANHPGPMFHEPLNMRIAFYGAISENMPAPIGDVAEWTSKWSGPYHYPALTGGGTPTYLSYSYDPVLRSTRIGADNKTTYPIFPYLPMTPDLLIWGERVSGVGGAGV